MSVTALPISPVAPAATVGTSVARDPGRSRPGAAADFAALLERAAAAPAEPTGTAARPASERDRRLEPLPTANGPAALSDDAPALPHGAVSDPAGTVVTEPDSTTTESTGADSVAAVAPVVQAPSGAAPVVTPDALPAGSAAGLASADAGAGVDVDAGAEADAGATPAGASGPVPAGPSGGLLGTVDPGPGLLAQMSASPPVAPAELPSEDLAGPVAGAGTGLLGTGPAPAPPGPGTDASPGPDEAGPVTGVGSDTAVTVGTSAVGVAGGTSPADAGGQPLEVVSLAPASGAGNAPVAGVSGPAVDIAPALPAPAASVPGVVGASEVLPASTAGPAPQPPGEQLRTPLGEHVTSLATTLRRDGAGNARVVLRLDPPELGSVTVSVSLRGGEVRVVLVAADPAAAAALEARRAEVRASLASGGLALDSYSVGADAGSGRERRGTPWRPADAAWRRPDPGSDWTARSADRATSGVWL